MKPSFELSLCVLIALVLFSAIFLKAITYLMGFFS